MAPRNVSRKVVDSKVKAKTLAIDFDGVIHRYSRGWQGHDNAYDCQMEDVEWAFKRFIAHGYELVIVSSRPKEVIEEWLVKHRLAKYIKEVSNYKVPARYYIDDHAYKFTTWKQAVRDLAGGTVVWFTGLPCSGKTTVADIVADKLRRKGYPVERLDGDIIRDGSLSRDLSFSPNDRERNMERVAFVARMLARNGVIVLCSFVSPTDTCRYKVREEVEKDTIFLEIYVKCALDVCKERDVKGMYAKAEKGEIKDFTGVDAEFIEPTVTDYTVTTDDQDVEDSVNRVMYFLRGRI